MTRKRQPSLEKQRHEVRLYLRQLRMSLLTASQQYGFRLCPISFSILPDATGLFFVPSRQRFQKTHPLSPPTGLVFPDGSFLIIREIVRFGYQQEMDVEPHLYHLSYSYHYQRPADRYYFRFDHHPELGVDRRHPEYHLHSAGWQEGALHLRDKPRFKVEPIDLDEVLLLIADNFFT